MLLIYQLALKKNVQLEAIVMGEYFQKQIERIITSYESYWTSYKVGKLRESHFLT